MADAGLSSRRCPRCRRGVCVTAAVVAVWRSVRPHPHHRQVRGPALPAAAPGPPRCQGRTFAAVALPRCRVVAAPTRRGVSLCVALVTVRVSAVAQLYNAREVAAAKVGVLRTTKCRAAYVAAWEVANPGVPAPAGTTSRSVAGLMVSIACASRALSSLSSSSCGSGRSRDNDTATTAIATTPRHMSNVVACRLSQMFRVRRRLQRSAARWQRRRSLSCGSSAPATPTCRQT
jgi:hypothetical protein